MPQTPPLLAPLPSPRLSQSNALTRLQEAEDTLRAIGAGEVDAFIVSDGGGGQHVFTLSTADLPYRMFVENMQDGAATLSPSGVILYANRRLAQLLSRSTETIVGSALATFVAGSGSAGLDEIRGPGGLGATVELDLLDGNGVAVPVLVGSSPLDVHGDLLTCLTFTDLSAQKAQDREIARLEAQAEHDRLQARDERDCLEARLRQSQRLESLGQLAGGVAHDFNNLLGAIQGFTSFVKMEVDAAAALGEQRWVSVSADVEQIDRAAERAAHLTHQLLAFARREVVRPEVLNLNDVVVDVEQLLRRTLGEHVELVATLGHGLQLVCADRGQLEQVLINLSINARDAMPRGGRLTIATSNIDIDYALSRPELRPGRYVRLCVSDTGTGMDDAVIERAFEPFFTTKPSGSGTGLGLATVYGIISQAGGHTQISSEPGIGTTVTALLPTTEEPASTEPTRVDTRRHNGHETLLVVEDEDALREVTRRVLVSDGYEVLTAANGAEALRVAAEYKDEIALLITDFVMPGMLGKEVAERILATRPNTAVLFTSGYAQGVLARAHTLDPGVPLIEKPFSATVLSAAVRKALDA
jgi:signal transduction histidine kinase